MDGADKSTRGEQSHYTSTVCVSVCLNYVNKMNAACLGSERGGALIQSAMLKVWKSQNTYTQTHTLKHFQLRVSLMTISLS